MSFSSDFEKNEKQEQNVRAAEGAAGCAAEAGKAGQQPPCNGGAQPGAAARAGAPECAEACKHLSDRRQHDQKSAVCGKSAAEHCFSAAREHTAGLSRHRQPEHAAEQFTAACKHLSDRRQRDKKSAVCGKSAESAFFRQERRQSSGAIRGRTYLLRTRAAASATRR